MHEASEHDRNCFLTLTYSDEHLPEDGSLDLRHWQLFAKRMRKRVGPFRFFHCGEYGDRFGRPHYHALIFGQDFREDREPYGRSGSGMRYDVSPTLTELWQKGHATIGELTWQSAAYTARYVMKKVTGPRAEAHYEGRKPEYVTMSRGGRGGKGGIGKGWLEKYTSDVYPDDFVVHEGRKFRVPRYYDQVMAEKDPELVDGLKAERVERAKQHAEDNTPERLLVKEKVLNRRLKSLHRPVD